MNASCTLRSMDTATLPVTVMAPDVAASISVFASAPRSARTCTDEALKVPLPSMYALFCA